MCLKGKIKDREEEKLQQRLRSEQTKRTSNWKRKIWSPETRVQ